jgi:vancomycin resistance protein VanJ
MTAAPRLTLPMRVFAIGVVVLNGLYVLALGALTFFDWAGPERWWLTGFLQFVPRWPWAVPAALLLLPTAYIARGAGGKRRWGAVVPILCLLWVAGPVMGLCVNVPDRSPGGTRLRVLTYNVEWGRRDRGEIAREIIAARPDLVQFQDASGVIANRELRRVLAPERGWSLRWDGQYIVASRWPISNLSSVDIGFPGSGYHAVRSTLTPPDGGPSVTVYNVHLLSPRVGLVLLRERMTVPLEQNLRERQIEAERLADAIANGPVGPTVVTGDLNAPPRSLALKPLRRLGLRDAFEEAGIGYGYTYGAATKAGRPYVRIDHILVSRHFRVGSARVGNDHGSDHCPVIADLYLARP